MLTAAVFVVAFLYSCVGHAGASGYIAAMTLFGLAPDAIKPAALALNILVATLATWQFRRAGHFSWGLFRPLALASVPCAFLGGWLNLPTQAFKIAVGLVLLFSAARFLLDPPAESGSNPPSLPAALGVGAGLGLLSGLTGTGGGIFLTPLGIFLRWDATKTIAAVSAAFILVNSAAGLAGHLIKTRSFPDAAPALALAALAGGAAGSYLGSARLPHAAIKRLLAVVLAVAGFKLIFA
ncbi:MAG: sulfite exporter TauE/SafE family protein [Elusimicrobiota bacterium]|nr:sulfite exporter TauE/SafE family protein [Elusimicrobiota bacterium]